MPITPEDYAAKADEILKSCGEDTRVAIDKLIPIIYEDLRRQARLFFRKEAPDHTFQTTDVVHELYLQLIKQHSIDLSNREEVFAITSIIIRRVLANYAKRKNRKKRGGEVEKIQLNENLNDKEIIDKIDIDLIKLDEALEELKIVDLQASRIVELKFYSGLTIKEISEILNISEYRVKDDWKFARTWLYQKLEKENNS